MLMILPLLLAQASMPEVKETFYYSSGNVNLTIEVADKDNSFEERHLFRTAITNINPLKFAARTDITLSPNHSLVGEPNTISHICFPSVNLNKVRYIEVYYDKGKLSHKEITSTQREAGIQFFPDKVRVQGFLSNVHTRDYDKVTKYIIELSQ